MMGRSPRRGGGWGLLPFLLSLLPPSLSSFLSSNFHLVAFGSVMLASAALNTVFVLYYVDLFTQSAHANLTPGWFYAGQTAYL